MMTSAQLLRQAADVLDRGDDPFTDSFLSANDVTSGQAMALASVLAIGARIVAAGIEKPDSPQGQAMLLTMADQL